jgi:glycine/D-amino acid oxidase-like deaminating enzyme
MMTKDPRFESYWWEAAPLVDLPEKPVPETMDVAIVGSGFTGLSAAITLACAGRDVHVFEKDRPGEGASSRTGGHTSAKLKMSFSQMIKVYGLERAKTIYGEGKQAREDLTQFVHDNGIDCDFRLAGRLLSANQPAHYEHLGREADCLNQHLDIGAHMVPRAEMRGELGSDHYHGAIVLPDVGCVHPGLLHKGMLEKALASGVTVHGRTAVTGVQRQSGGFQVSTGRGATRAGEVIVATNGYSGPAIPWLQRRVIPIPSQIIVTEPIEPALMDRLMPKRRVVGETRALYHYFRPTPDDTRILFGGKANLQASDERRTTRELRKNLVEIFPELKDVGIGYSWWGNTGFTFDFLPKLVENDGIHYALGYNGSGVVWGYWLGIKAAFRLLGNPDARTVFDEAKFQTRPLYTGWPWFLPAAFMYFGLKDRLRL